MLGLPFIKWYGVFSFCLGVDQECRTNPQLLNVKSWRDYKGVCCGYFWNGTIFLVLVCSTAVPVQMLLAERAPHYPVNTQGSRSYGRAKGQEWLRQYVIWLSSPGNQSLEKDTQFALPRSGAEPVSGAGDVTGMVTNPHACYKHH